MEDTYVGRGGRCLRLAIGELGHSLRERDRREDQGSDTGELHVELGEAYLCLWLIGGMWRMRFWMTAGMCDGLKRRMGICVENE